MGESYRFSLYGKWSMGINFSYEYRQLIIRVPFIDIHVSFSKYAHGIFIFGKEF